MLAFIDKLDMRLSHCWLKRGDAMSMSHAAFNMPTLEASTAKHAARVHWIMNPGTAGTVKAIGRLIMVHGTSTESARAWVFLGSSSDGGVGSIRNNLARNEGDQSKEGNKKEGNGLHGAKK